MLTQNVITIAAKCNTNTKCNNINAKCNKIINAKCNNFPTQNVITFLTQNVITQIVITPELQLCGGGEKVLTGLRDSCHSQTIRESMPSKFSSYQGVF